MIEELFQVGQDLSNKLGGDRKVSQLFEKVEFSTKTMKYAGLGEAHKVTLSSSGFSKWTVVHELAHAWDGANGWELSAEMKSSLDAGFDHPILH